MIESKKEMKQWIELERKIWIKRNYPSGVKKKVFRKELLFQSVLRHAEYYSNVKGASKIIGIYWKILFNLFLFSSDMLSSTTYIFISSASLLFSHKDCIATPHISENKSLL